MKSIKRFYAAFIAFLLMSGFACAQNIFPANGHVGVGTLSPQEKIQIGDSSQTKINLRIGRWGSFGLTGGGVATILGNNAIASTIANNRINIMETTTDGARFIEMRYDKGIVFHSFLGNVSAGSAFSSERMRLDNNGRLGIGTTRPSRKLDVAGITRTHMIEITGGSDLAEPFDVAGADVQPGMVVSIDPELPGQLRVSNTAYDHTVAGIISGANGLKPGLTMKQEGSIGDGSYPIALSGRVYCLADASKGSIRPGDLLTTADLPGYVMRVGDHTKALGAIIGKAMSVLEEGKGLVLVLVNLQ